MARLSISAVCTIPWVNKKGNPEHLPWASAPGEPWARTCCSSGHIFIDRSKWKGGIPKAFCSLLRLCSGPNLMPTAHQRLVNNPNNVLHYCPKANTIPLISPGPFAQLALGTRGHALPSLWTTLYLNSGVLTPETLLHPHLRAKNRTGLQSLWWNVFGVFRPDANLSPVVVFPLT